MIHNRVGPPVTGNDFFNRESFVHQVSEKLREGNHILLAAPRRFGKTSIMYKLIQQPLWDYHVVHVDLESLHNPADLVARLMESTAKVSALATLVAGLSTLAAKMVGLVNDHAEEIEVFDVRVKLRDAASANWREHLQALMGRIATADKPVVIFLDELPMLLDRLCKTKEGKNEAIALMRWLRELRQAPEMKILRFVLAGSIGIERILNQLGEIATINDFERMKLQVFTQPVAEQFLDSLAATYSFSLDIASRSAMLELIGPPVPYFLQILFSETRKACEDEQVQACPEMIARIYREKVLGEDCKTYFDHYYSRFRLYYPRHLEVAAKHILRELAQVGEMRRDACQQFYREAVGDKFDTNEFAGMMADLEYEFYVAFDADQRVYRFACKLLRDWWLRHYGL
ncbi:ATP-binding protein [Methylosoma difficile]